MLKGELIFDILVARDYGMVHVVTEDGRLRGTVKVAKGTDLKRGVQLAILQAGLEQWGDIKWAQGPAPYRWQVLDTYAVVRLDSLIRAVVELSVASASSNRLITDLMDEAAAELPVELVPPSW